MRLKPVGGPCRLNRTCSPGVYCGYTRYVSLATFVSHAYSGLVRIVAGASALSCPKMSFFYHLAVRHQHGIRQDVTSPTQGSSINAFATSPLSAPKGPQKLRTLSKSDFKL